jgi:ABC-2 type transport system permease protein
MKQILSITRKELSSYFGSPLALIFVGVFLAAALVVVFWVDAFFARGIADVRPLFRWMPVLMIFLVAALTMRQWSEEQRSGTLEVLLTLPVSNVQLVLGKFLAVMALVALSLALTLFLPITVSLIGNLDWGPVIGGYIAALLLAAAYTAIGLYISSRTDNQIVALILTALVCGLFYAVGSSSITDLVGGTPAEILRAIGAGSRFESIQRGVIDLRDLIYYLTLAGVFLVLNVIALDVKRWSQGQRTKAYRRAMTITAALLEVNLIAVNVWIYPLNGLRLDLTQQHEYSLSNTTKDLLANLQEPLLIRGYFSEKTHPLLSPLVPQMRDMLQEYQIAGRGKVTVDVVDPSQNPAKEQEANQTYGIQPTPLQVSGRYEASVINAYFDILVRYGDQNVTLNFRDLIATQAQRDGTTAVTLRNPEYDLTRSIKKVVYGFQSVDSVLAAMSSPVKLTLFVTPDTLPDALKTAPATIQKVAQDLQTKSNGKFTFEQINPDAPNAKVNRQALVQTYHLQPIAASLFSSDSYYMDMVLQVTDASGAKSQVLSLSGDPSEANVRTAIESALKRSASGFLKVVGLWMPSQQPTVDQFGQQQQPLATFQQAQQQLSRDYTVHQVDLSTGQVPPDVDTLVVLAPQGMNDKAKYAIDQYLMRGGSVVVAAGSYMLTPPDQVTGTWLGVKPIDGGLADMLESYGVKIEKSLVMDPQNEQFPIQVQRDVNGSPVNEVQLIPYPFSVDVRPDGMDRTNPIVSSVPMVTLNWASPLTVDADKNKGRQVSVLLKSSKNSWARTTPSIEPNLKQADLGFTPEGTQGPQTLAVAVTGSFQSFFKGKPSPLAATAPVTPTAQSQQQAQPTPAPVTSGSIDVSPNTARLVVIGSNDFLDDVVFQISASTSQDRYLNSLQFLQNAVDWSVEDLDLLSIRSRGTSSRVLVPMAQGQESFWEGLNYGLALLSLVVIGVFWTLRKRNERPMDLEAPAREPKKPASSQA